MEAAPLTLAQKAQVLYDAGRLRGVNELGSPLEDLEVMAVGHKLVPEMEAAVASETSPQSLPKLADVFANMHPTIAAMIHAAYAVGPALKYTLPNGMPATQAVGYARMFEGEPKFFSCSRDVDTGGLSNFVFFA